MTVCAIYSKMVSFGKAEIGSSNICQRYRATRLDHGPMALKRPMICDQSGLVVAIRTTKGFAHAKLAFASWPAFLVLLAGIIPTFVWRAAAEEEVLTATFGKRYALYQTQTKMIIPHLL